MKKKQIGIAMSGGVDSTACALLLRQDHDVHGFFMRLAGPGIAGQEQQAQDVARRLDIDLEVIDLSREFSAIILHYFTTSYQQGQTPNPCMLCNQTIKCGLFMDAILARGMDAMATGHYARIHEAEGTYHLYTGQDASKDQSYFLARLTQHQLERLVFPLGERTKEETYELVESQGLTGFRGQESQDVCFLGTTPVNQFLSEHIHQTATPGRIISGSGQVLGTHQGFFRYTIGQRRGLGIADTSPWYVTALDPQTNTVVVGREEELLRDQLLIRDPHWLNGQFPQEGRTYQTRIRYRHQGAETRVRRMDGNQWEISFTHPQRAITPGQFAVIYDQDRVIGCGEIQ